MKRFYLLLLLFPLQVFSQTLKVANLQCEYKSNPMGIEAASPKLSWELQTAEHNTMQTAYHVLVSDNAESLDKGIGNIWDSKRINSSASIEMAYTGKPLSSAKTYYWKVMVWDNHQHISVWSEVAKWQMGLLTPADWRNAKCLCANARFYAYGAFPGR
jgi:alpha-L-rhamnosidase